MKSLNQRGVFPILLLAAIGVALVAGGTYVVQNNLVTTKNGQIVFNGFKDKNLSDIKIPSPEPESPVTPSAKNAELADKTAEYKPDTGEPKFSMNPPAGWVKEKGEGRVKLFFEASQEDKKVFGYSTSSRSTANLQVTSEKSSAKSLDEIITKYKKEAAAQPVKIEILKEQ